MEESSRQSFCMECGAPLAPEHAFCTRCGTPRGSAGGGQPDGEGAVPPAPAEEAAAAEVPAVPAEKAAEGEVPVAPAQRRGGARWLLLTLVLVLIIGGAGGAAWWYLNRTQIVAVELGTGFGEDNTLEQTKSGFFASDIVCGSVLVKKPKAGQVLSVRWLLDGEEVAAQELRFPRTEEEKRLAVSLAPNQPLKPGEYLLEVSLRGGRAQTAAFTVEPSPPVEVKGFTVVSPEGNDLERVPSTATYLSASGTVVGANRFSRLSVVWKRDGITVRTKEISLTQADLEQAEDGVPFVDILDGPVGPYATPGEYTVSLMDGEQEIASHSVTVYVDTRIHSLAISEEVDADDSPVDPSDSFWYISQFYTTWYVESAPAGTTVEVRWYEDGELQDHLTYHRTYQWDVYDDYDWVRVYSTGWWLNAADWYVELYVNGSLADVAYFTIH